MIEAPIVTEWKAEAMGESLIITLGARFTTVPEDIAARIRSTKDGHQILEWTVKAATARDIDQFRRDAGLTASLATPP